MDYTLTIGNTHTVIGNRYGHPLRRYTTATLLDGGMLAEVGTKDRVFAACVVPAVRERLSSLPGLTIGFVDWRRIQKPDLSQVVASTVGADRLANAAALTAGRLPGLCVDFGTAIHSIAVDRDGRVAGGFILPGRQLMRNILAHGTAQLPAVDESDSSSRVLGRTTRAAMAAGIDHGSRGAVAALLRQAVQELGGEARIVLAGGDAPWFADIAEGVEMAGPGFTLHGVALLAEQHHFW